MHGQNPRRPVEKDHDGHILWVQEMFFTLQGEGPLSGVPAVFIRLGGCNLACTFCDTDFESNQDLFDVHEVATRVEEISADRSWLVVLTGGEPLRQNVFPLISRLNRMGYTVQVETSGSVWWESIPVLFPTRGGDDPRSANSIVVSPKLPAIPRRLRPYVHYLKYIVSYHNYNPTNGLPLMSTQEVGKTGQLFTPQMVNPEFPKHRVYLQPMDHGDEESNDKSRSAVVGICLKFGYRLCLQTHKIIGLP